MSEQLAADLVERAEKLGAVDAVPFRTEQIEFDSRTLLKCMYGCPDYVHRHTCPSGPNSLRPWEYRRILQEYEWGIIVHTHDLESAQRIALELERTAFARGCYFALALSDCVLCTECSGYNDMPCRHPGKARPSFHSVGIDVFATVEKFDLPIKVLEHRDEQQNWYSAVFVE